MQVKFSLLTLDMSMFSVHFSSPKQAKISVVLYMGLEITIVTVQTHH